jgi:OmpA-OmpF porin, OOP family
MTLQRLSIVAALAILSTTAVQGADFYAGANAGVTRWHTEDVPGFTTDRSDTGYKLFGGAQFSPNVAAEVGYVGLGKAKLTGAGISGNIKGTGLFIDLVGILPMSGDLSLFGKLGVFNGKAKGTAPGVAISDSGTDIKFGFGMAYALSKTMAVRGEWERYRFDLSGDKGDTDLLSIGLTFKF